MTNLSDYLHDLIEDAVKLGQESPADLEDKKTFLLADTISMIVDRLIGE